MKERLLFFGKYIIFWLAIFTFFKLIFVVYHISKMNGISLGIFLGIFYHGFKHDASITGYILILPSLLIIFLSFFKNRLLIKMISIYTMFLTAVISILEMIDLELYNYWRFRLDNAFAENLSTPKEMLANVNYFQLILLIIIVAILFYGIYNVFYRKFVLRKLNNIEKPDWKVSLLFIIITGMLFLPIRGGVSTAPLNTGSVYFQNNIVVNHAAINPVWNLFYSVTESDKLRYSVSFFDEKYEKEVLDSLYFSGTTATGVIKSGKPNIILIILESFSSEVLYEQSGREGITPNFSRLLKEGIFFSNMYASGSSSPLGLGAIISGYPALPNTCILYYEDKTQNIPAVSKKLDSLNYETAFFYGGDIDFAHIRSFLINTGYKRIISSENFSSSQYLSKWGVPDHLVFKRLLHEANQSSKPFFYSYFTLSSHEPFEVPMETVFPGNDRVNKYFNSVYYTDKSLGEFIDSAKTQSWWDNTLVILVADHGTRIEDITHFDRKRYHIPMLWLGGALKVKDTIVSKYGTQVDISKTLLNQLSVNTEDFVFGKDLLSEATRSFAMYTCQNGLGFVNDSLYLVYDLNSNKYLIKQGNSCKIELDYLKANMQHLLRDFKDR